jgi:AraC-like DNA-binding protein
VTSYSQHVRFALQPIIFIRLKRAAELLAGHSDNVTQIAYSVGFASLSYFNKCFKEQFGMTPGQFAGELLTVRHKNTNQKE